MLRFDNFFELEIAIYFAILVFFREIVGGQTLAFAF